MTSIAFVSDLRELVAQSIFAHRALESLRYE
jgi:hypothetical protein